MAETLLCSHAADYQIPWANERGETSMVWPRCNQPAVATLNLTTRGPNGMEIAGGLPRCAKHLGLLPGVRLVTEAE